MPRASALAPQAVRVVGSLFINRVHKVDNSTKDVKELFLVKLLWHIYSLLWQAVLPRYVLVLRSFHSLAYMWKLSLYLSTF
jgi:hypothetical protein